MAHGGRDRVRDDEPLQDFMNDVVKCARKAVRDAAARASKEERRKKVEERRASEAAAQQAAMARAEARKNKARKGAKGGGSESNPESRATTPGAKRFRTDGVGGEADFLDDDDDDDDDDGQTPRRGGAGTAAYHDKDLWKSDAAKLKASLACAFDVASDGLRVTWHAGAPGGGAPPGGGGLPALGSKSMGAQPGGGRPGSPGTKGGSGKLPTIVGSGGTVGGATKDTGGMGALAAAGKSQAAAAHQKRVKDLGFDCHHKYDASPLFTEAGAKAMKKIQKGSHSAPKDDDPSSGPTGPMGGKHGYTGGGGMVSATDGLKQAILSGKIVSSDGTVVQALVAELQGPTSWSGQDIGIKYRGEFEREAAWRAYVQAAKASDTIHAHQGAFFATATMARHLL
jgi:hypothetical protein